MHTHGRHRRHSIDTAVWHMTCMALTWHRHSNIDQATLQGIEHQFRGRAVFVSAFPPCTDLSCAGAPHWRAKAKVDPNFMNEAAGRIQRLRNRLRRWERLAGRSSHVDRAVLVVPQLTGILGLALQASGYATHSG